MMGKSSILPSIEKERKSATFPANLGLKSAPIRPTRQPSPTSKTHAKTTWKLKVNRGKEFFSQILKTFTFEDCLVKMGQS